MPKAERSEVFDVGIEAIYTTIIDFESTAEFVDGVSEVEVIQQDENSAEVRYSLNLIKKFSYVLKLTLQRPHRIEWTFLEGDLMKSNSGYWILEDLGDGQTKVTYSVDIEFKMFAPKMIIKKLVEGNLPSMMQAYKERAKQRG